MADLMRMREAMSPLSQPFGGPGDGAEGAWGHATWVPPVDIYETEDAFIIEAERPGFTREDVEIALVENRLTLRGERKRPSVDGRAVHTRTGRAEASDPCTAGGHDGDNEHDDDRGAPHRHHRGAL